MIGSLVIVVGIDQQDVRQTYCDAHNEFNIAEAIVRPGLGYLC